MPDTVPHLRDRLAPMIRRRGIRATARHVGVHHAMLVDWMANRRDIPVEVLLRLARCLKLRIRLDEAPRYPDAMPALPPPTKRGDHAGSRIPPGPA